MQQQPETLSLADIEKEKDKMDLRPAIGFIEKYKDSYTNGMNALMQREPTIRMKEWASTLNFPHEDRIRGPQTSSEEARQLLARMPEALAALSHLRTVSYEYANQVIEPVYNPNGTLKTGNTVEFEQFGNNNEHPTRLLVGMTPYSGDTIYLSALPSTIYEKPESAHMYQMHVLLHEFFHTVEIHRRDPAERSKIILETDGKRFTFQEWWERFEELVLRHIEKPVSRYAAGYEHDLTESMKRTDEKKFTHALAEQICESFVAYQQNIIPNDEGLKNFKVFWPITWWLMDTLCRAKLISKGDKIDV